MTTLESLPDEMLMHIFSYLRVPESSSGYEHRTSFYQLASFLRGLCLVSKRLRPIAQRLLHYSIPSLRETQRYLLLRTLVECPDLANSVRAIDLGETYNSASEIQDLFELARPRLNISDNLAEKIIGDAEEEEIGSDYSFILLLVPNIERLDLACWYGMDLTMHDLIKGTRDSSNGAAVPLGRLREIWLRHGDTEGCTTLEPLGLLALPTLRTLRGHALEWTTELQPEIDPETEETDDEKQYAPRLALEHIDLKWSLCNEESLENMISRCPDLKTLRIEWGSATVGVDDDLNFDGIGHVLREFGGKLEELMLDCRRAFMYEDLGEATFEIGSLRELSRLRTLVLPHNILVGQGKDTADRKPLKLQDVLPTSLETLRLFEVHHDERALDDQLYEMITSKKWDNLRKVIMLGREDPFYHDLAEYGWVSWRMWGKVCLATEAEFRLIPKETHQFFQFHGQQTPRDWISLRWA
ncbi:hypothetical protein KJ359_008874 [Pestalotiopsis sp. 9143b]|nr:hypothetical protein KJ359_008874 [Pestalotiopsis sp. 9143b]